MQVIGICGGNWGGDKVGKTLASKIICDRFNFAKADCMQPVLEVAQRLAGWDGELSDEGKRIIDSVCRSGRIICEDYWLNLAVGSLDPDASGLVIDNVFFRNEHQYVIDSGGILIRLVKFKGQVFESDSERTDMPVTTVVNDGSIDMFSEKLIQVVCSAAAIK